MISCNRYAEVLLNYAEAVYERNGSISDLDLNRSLNLVRNRVNKTMPNLAMHSFRQMAWICVPKFVVKEH
jgi:hypothetical protein